MNKIVDDVLNLWQKVPLMREYLSYINAHSISPHVYEALDRIKPNTTKISGKRKFILTNSTSPRSFQVATNCELHHLVPKFYGGAVNNIKNFVMLSHKSHRMAHLIFVLGLLQMGSVNRTFYYDFINANFTFGDVKSFDSNMLFSVFDRQKIRVRLQTKDRVIQLSLKEFVQFCILSFRRHENPALRAYSDVEITIKALVALLFVVLKWKKCSEDKAGTLRYMLQSYGYIRKVLDSQIQSFKLENFSLTFL